MLFVREVLFGKINVIKHDNLRVPIDGDEPDITGMVCFAAHRNTTNLISGSF